MQMSVQNRCGEVRSRSARQVDVLMHGEALTTKSIRSILMQNISKSHMNKVEIEGVEVRECRSVQACHVKEVSDQRLEHAAL
jgi:tRNA U34 5-carboxymethylaminomethyl modifying enzyme MnmG/GidA